jgi:hypothetical protein
MAKLEMMIVIQVEGKLTYKDEWTVMFIKDKVDAEAEAYEQLGKRLLDHARRIKK